jgi:hypothetical protein
MPFYDAYKGNVAGVDVRLDPSGSAAKSFGDAFANYGRSLREEQASRTRQERVNAATQTLADELKDKQAAKEQQTIDDSLTAAFGDYATPKDYRQNVGGLELASPEVKQKLDAHFQNKFNDEAVKVSVTGGYDDFKGFTSANPELVQNADGTTMAKIEQYFAGKDKRVATAKAAEEDAKHQKELLKMQEKVVKAQKAAKGGKGGFKYTENTDAKIAAQVKTAMGMDAPDFTFTDANKKEFQDTVAGSSKISKKYGLEPSLAIHVYTNPDLYDFTADGKVIARKVTAQQKEKPAAPSWKDYDPAGS